MAGKVTITIISGRHTTKELEEECHRRLGHWSRIDKIYIYITPSDDTEEQIAWEYGVR